MTEILVFAVLALVVLVIALTVFALKFIVTMYSDLRKRELVSKIAIFPSIKQKMAKSPVEKAKDFLEKRV